MLPLPDGHRFPMAKYSRLRERVAGIASELHVPEPISRDALEAVHCAEYVARVFDGRMSEAEVRRLGFPWSPELVVRSRQSVGGTLAACRSALEGGLGINLAGGTHHAGRDWGEGFCVFNDCVVALRALGLERAVVVDLDVHQGNGTAAMLDGDPSCFTFSMHGARNFPLRKHAGDLDVALEDGTGDDAYLEALSRTLPTALEGARLAIYLAGADPFEGDRLGRLALTKGGLRARDEMVAAACRERGIPLVVVMGGGYAPDVQDIVDIHFATVEVALQTWKRALR